MPEFSPDPSDRPDLVGVLPKLRVFAWRAAGIAMLWLLPVVGGALGIWQLYTGAQQLLDHGTRVTGTVLAESTAGKGPWSIDVRYPVDGAEHTATVLLGWNRTLERGSPITVVVDPADPGHIRTPDDDNISDALQALCIGAMIAGVVGACSSGVAARRWQCRYVAVGRTGWRSASVTVHKAPRTRTEVDVRYPGGETVAEAEPGLDRWRRHRHGRAVCPGRTARRWSSRRCHWRGVPANVVCGMINR